MNLSIFILFSKITVALMIVGGVYGLIHSLREIRKIRYWQYEKDIPYLFGLMVLHAFIGGACGVIISLIGGIPALVTSFITPEAIGLSMSISLLITVSGGIVVIFYRRVFYKIKNNIIKISLSLSIGLITTLFVIFLELSCI